MPVLLTPPELQFFDDDGEPLSGGFVYTYQAGTTTPKATFTDSTGNTQNTNPVELDASGRAPIWIEGSYKFVVTDADGATITTTDNVTAFSAQVESTEGFFQSFSGNGSTTAFTLSEDLGTDEKALMIFIDAGLQNVVTNGTFATDSGWTKGTGWTIGAGVATASGAISTALEQSAAVTLLQGQNYVVTMTITRSAGSLTASVGGTSGTARSSSGTYVETITAGSSQVLAFTGSGFTGTIDNITITPAVSAGYNIQNPSAYTVNGTALTFSTAPPTGTNNIQVWAPYTLIGAAGSAQTAADAAAASAAAALVSENNAASSEANAAASEAAVVAAIDTIADMNVDLFTGDGAEVNFTLSGEPGNENNTWVSVSGLVISTAAYSLSGTTLTFSVAPANLAPIVVRWGFPIGASVADGSVTTIKLADEAVTAAKIGSGAATDGQVLTADGSGGASWENAGGGLVPLASVTASSSATVDFTGIPTTYDVYIVELTDIRPATDGSVLRMLMSINNGSSYIGSGYLGQLETVNSASVSASAMGSTSLFNLADSVSNSASETVNGQIIMPNLKSSVAQKAVISDLTYLKSSDSSVVGQKLYAFQSTTSAVDAIRFQMNSGNITSGTFRLYGVAKS